MNFQAVMGLRTLVLIGSAADYTHHRFHAFGRKLSAASGEVEERPGRPTWARIKPRPAFWASAGRSRTGSPNPEDCYGEDSIWEDKCESYTTPGVSAEAQGG